MEVEEGEGEDGRDIRLWIGEGVHDDLQRHIERNGILGKKNGLQSVLNKMAMTVQLGFQKNVGSV